MAGRILGRRVPGALSRSFASRVSSPRFFLAERSFPVVCFQACCSNVGGVAGLCPQQRGGRASLSCVSMIFRLRVSRHTWMKPAKQRRKRPYSRSRANMPNLQNEHSCDLPPTGLRCTFIKLDGATHSRGVSRLHTVRARRWIVQCDCGVGRGREQKDRR